MEKNTYKEALLLLLRVIVFADGVFDKEEENAIKEVCQLESISDEYYQDFCNRAEKMSEKEMYLNGIDKVHICTLDEQLKVFVWLYKIAEVDGKVHVKEVRFLLYSIRHADIEFDQVEEAAAKTPSLSF